MLRELHIFDFAIIDELHVTLEPGFNILTGETGAGKSILIDAVALLLGGRADATAIRTGAVRARVEGQFILPPLQQATLAPLLKQEGLLAEDSHLWLTRELRANGRSVARINGSLVSATLLRRVAEGLVDIHGQSEHLSLLRVREHLQLLDRFAGLAELRSTVSQAVRRLQATRRELAALREGEQARQQRLELLRFQVQEIEQAALHPGELQKLEEERVRLANAKQLASLTATLLTLFEGEEDESQAVVDLLGRAQRELRVLARVDATLSPQEKTLAEIVYAVEDLTGALRDYRDEIEFNPQRLAQVEGRLVLLQQLERKYGCDLAGVLDYAARATAELEMLEHSDEHIAALELTEQDLRATAARLCEELSRRRQEAARALAAGIEVELADLQMQGARFGVSFRWREEADGIPLESPLPPEVWVTAGGKTVQEGASVRCAAFDITGMDRLEFLVAPNLGEGLKPLTRIASGGETSRLMLALKTVLSRADYTLTLIFDEIDQGIGGRVGAVVGAKLWRLTVPAADQGVEPGEENMAEGHQVLCITHLPQLAGFGDAHYHVQKIVTGGRTVARARRLDHEACLDELGQMLGLQGASARQGAREILEQAGELKRSVGSGSGL
ncbi:MAG: DNA repair protein RecN [Anaerolineae bacterium]|nr:DNA repair protein RecN [Anaerolineae bacterium]